MSKVLLMIREMGSLQKMNKVIKLCLVLLISFAIILVMLASSYSGEVNKGLSDSLIRLHVIANSDSPEDQALKLEVRDAVIAYMKDILKDSKNVEHSSLIINSNIDKIKSVALDEIKRHGEIYKIDAAFGKYPFPTKVYGDVALPAGSYTALKVVIGKGEGANWWCVLFPPLCFVDATHGTVPDAVKDDLKSALTEEEYNLITSVDSDDEIPIKVKFKVVEFFEDSKIKFTGVINKIFGN